MGTRATTLIALRQLCATYGSFDMDLMDFTASAQRCPTTSRQISMVVSFYSRFHTDGTSGIDVLAQGASKKPASRKICFGFYVPPPSIVGVHISHLQACRVPVLDTKASWFPLLKSTLVRFKPAASKANPNVFVGVCQGHGAIPVVSQKWDMRSVV